LIAPGYLITPYLIAPIFEDIMPYWVNKRKIRSMPSMPTRECETKLMCCEFDIAWRYSDLLTNFTICIALFMYSTHYMWAIMAWLLIANVIVYVTDHYRLLRCTTQTFHVTDVLHTAFAYWWAIPVGFIGSISIHWAMNAKWISASPTVAYVYQVIFMLGHCALYGMMLNKVRNGIKKPVVPEVPYQEMCEARLGELDGASYFNVNPVHVLRSWFFPHGFDESTKHCIPYAHGKEHLLLPDSKVTAHLEERLAIADKEIGWAPKQEKKS